MKYSIFIILGFLWFCSSCGNKECDFGGKYEFVIPTTLSPAKDTFQIGDTITVTSNFSDMVYDQKTKKKYHLVDFKFYPLTIIYKLDTQVISYDLNDFDIVVDSLYKYSIFTFSDGNKHIEGQYRYHDNRYSLEYKIIPKRAGLFFHVNGAPVSVEDEFQDFEGRCRHKASGAIVRLNDGEDNNVDYLLESPVQGEYGYGRVWEKKDEKFYKHGGYCFYVE